MAHAATGIAIATLLAVVSAIALAWDTGEFKSGEPQDRVLERFRSRGFKIQEFSPTSYFATHGNDATSLGFCNGRLTAHGVNVQGGIRGFIRRVSQLSKQYGEGKLGARVSETNLGELTALSVTWTLGSDSLRVSYVAKSEFSAESQSVAWFTRSECQEQLP
jgi:hypothetical protein